MSISRSICMDALLLLSIYLNSMGSLLFSWKIKAVLPFQYHEINRIRKHNGRQRNAGTEPMGWASTSPMVYKIPRKTFLGLSSDPRISNSQFTQQQLSSGPMVNSRDMASLSEWSRSANIVLADGVELTEDLLGDWSLTTTKSIEQGSSIMTIPAEVILTSDIKGDSYSPYYTDDDMKNIRDWMESELESGSQAKQDYVPEYMLVYKLLREVHMGMNSRWYSWLQSLPTQFSTGLYLDEVERHHVERMTGEYIKIQRLQYQACLQVFQKLVTSERSKRRSSLVPTDFLEWMAALQQENNNGETKFDSLVKWAYSIVFTRSWRSPDRMQAQIVPLGDLANHDSQFANLKPGFREKDGAFQFFVTRDIEVVGSNTPKLYLSYGLTYSPARFLVIFGFCDVTAAYIDANLGFLPDGSDEWPTELDPTQLVVSTLNGALSEEVWVAFLYKMLQKSQPDVLPRIKEAFEDGEDKGNAFVEDLIEKWEYEVGSEIREYYQRLLETDFAPITVGEKDLAEHSNLGMIVNYNFFMRDTYLSVLEHVNTFLAQCDEFKSLAAANIDRNTVPGSVGDSNLQSQANLSKQTNTTSLNEKNASSSKTTETTTSQSSDRQPSSAKTSFINSTDTKLNLSEKKSISTSMPINNSKNAYTTAKSFEPVSGLVSAQKYSPTTKREKNSTYENPPSVDNAPQSSQETFLTDSVSAISSTYSSEPFSTDPESQKMADWNAATGLTNMNIGQAEGASLDSPSRFSSENFSLQSYSSTNPANDENSNSKNDELPAQKSNGTIPTGNFNPKYYTASRKGKMQQNTDFSAAPNGNVESESYSDTNSMFPNGNTDQVPYSFDQTSPTQEQIGSGTSPAFPYTNPNSQMMYSQGQIATPSFDYENYNSLPYSDMDANPIQEATGYYEQSVFPDADMDFQPDADVGFRPDADVDFHTNSDYRNPESYYNGGAMQTDQFVNPGLTPAFQKDTISGFQPDANDQAIPSQQKIDSTINDGESSQQQNGADLATSYAQSLVSDQRGTSQNPSGEPKSLKQKNSDLPSSPTTYAEYMQQRQQEGQSGDGI